MRFCPDTDDPNWFYVDREIDDKADHFMPCMPCAYTLHSRARPGTIWYKGILCGECYTALETLSEIADARDERLQIMDVVREPWIIGSDGALRRPDEPAPGGPASAEDLLPGLSSYLNRIP